MRYEIRVSRTVETTIDVEADSARAAARIVDSRDFPMPPLPEWATVKGSWEYVVVDEHGGSTLFTDAYGD